MQSDLPFSDTLTFLKMQKAPAECFHKAEGFVYHFRRRYPLLLGGEKYVFRHHLTGKNRRTQKASFRRFKSDANFGNFPVVRETKL